MTYRYLAYDILESFKQTFDDKEIGLNHVLFWIETIANRMASKTLIKTQGRWNVTGNYLNVFSAVAVNLDDTTGRKFSTLPEFIFDLDNENAIQYITYEPPIQADCDKHNYTKVSFLPTTPAKSRRLYYNCYEKPSAKNPYFYRRGNRLYYLGIDNVDISTVEMGLYTALDPTNVTSLDADIPLPPEKIQILRYEVLNLGKLVLMVPQDRVNEGNDATSTGQKPKALPDSQPYGGAQADDDMASVATTTDLQKAMRSAAVSGKTK
tara:strand:- start:28 stop:822 length:795 start_codon:yes stop_codon:yes gene_type:complete